MLRPPVSWRVDEHALEAFLGSAPNGLEIRLAHELAWRNKSEWEIREAQDAAVRRRRQRSMRKARNLRASGQPA